MPEGEAARPSSRIRTGTEEGTRHERVSTESSFTSPRGASGSRPYRHRGESRRVMTNGSGDGGNDAENPLGPAKVSINCWFPVPTAASGLLGVRLQRQCQRLTAVVTPHLLEVGFTALCCSAAAVFQSTTGVGPLFDHYRSSVVLGISTGVWGSSGTLEGRDPGMKTCRWCVLATAVQQPAAVDHNSARTYMVTVCLCLRSTVGEGTLDMSPLGMLHAGVMLFLFLRRGCDSQWKGAVWSSKQVKSYKFKSVDYPEVYISYVSCSKHELVVPSLDRNLCFNGPAVEIASLFRPSRGFAAGVFDALVWSDGLFWYTTAAQVGAMHA